MAISYKWQANGVDITGATGATFSPGQDQVGLPITVKASYTDASGALESKTSGATAAVANVNDLPTGASPPPFVGALESKTSSATPAVANVNDQPVGGVTIGGSANPGQTLTASNTLTDADGPATLAVTWG